MLQVHLSANGFWHAFTRLGEAEILLPVALVLFLWMAVHPGTRRLVLWWAGMLVLAASITTVSKVAFIGFGVGVPALNFTGVSGHSMFAACIYPPLLVGLASSRPPAWQRGALLAGCALALLVGVSRVMVGAHSVSEVMAGLALGGAASGAALWMARMPHARLPVWLPLAVAAWLLVTPGNAPPSHTHDMVTRLSLAVSGRSAPYTRHEMLRDWQRRRTALPPAPLQTPHAAGGSALAA